MEDQWLIYRCRHGSDAAFCRIYAKYKELLFKLAVSIIGDVHLAEDIVHDVFVVFAENISHFRLTGSLKGYLSVCVVNRARNLLQSNRTRIGLLSEDDDKMSTCAETDHRIILNEQLQRLAKAMEQLPIEQRQIIAMRHYSSMRFGAIAQSLDIPTETAKSRYRYGMEKLRTALNKEEQ